MPDEKNRELERKAVSGDLDAAIKLIKHGAQANYADFILTGMREAITKLSRDELSLIFDLVASEKAKKDLASYEDVPEPYDQAKKALEIKLSDKYTLAELCHHITGIMESATTGELYDEVQVTRTRTTQQYYNTWGAARSTETEYLSNKEILKKVDKAFEGQTGEFIVKISGPIRVYAVQHPASKELLEIQEKTKKLQEIKRKLDKHKADQEKARKKKKACELEEEEAKLREKELRMELERLKQNE